MTSKVWRDCNIKSAKQAKKEGFSTGSKNPTVKGRQLVVVHVGGEKGFINERLLLFSSSKSGEYHH